MEIRSGSAGVKAKVALRLIWAALFVFLISVGLPDAKEEGLRLQKENQRCTVAHEAGGFLVVASTVFIWLSKGVILVMVLATVDNGLYGTRHRTTIENGIITEKEYSFPFVVDTRDYSFNRILDVTLSTGLLERNWYTGTVSFTAEAFVNGVAEKLTFSQKMVLNAPSVKEQLMKIINERTHEGLLVEIKK